MQMQSQQSTPDDAPSAFSLFFLQPLMSASRADRPPEQPQPSAAAAPSQSADLDDDDVEAIDSDEEDARRAAERAGWGSSAAAAAAARQPFPSLNLDPRLRPAEAPPLWHSGLPFAPHVDLNDVAHVRVRQRTDAQQAQPGSAQPSSQPLSAAEPN